MSTPYFKKALSNFSFEMGSAGEIRALFLTTRDINEIKKKLTFKVDDEKIRETVLDYLISKKVILRESDINEGNYEIKKVEDIKNFQSEYIRVKKDDNIDLSNYTKVDFYKLFKNNDLNNYNIKDNISKDTKGINTIVNNLNGSNINYKNFINKLSKEDRDYLELIPWEENMYHIKDERLMRILRLL